MTRRETPLCPRTQTEAVLYAAGEMASAASEEYARHLESCPACAAAVAEERDLAPQLRLLPARRASPASLAALSLAARQFVERRAERPFMGFEPWFADVRPRIAVVVGWACAATLLLVSAQILRTFPAHTASPDGLPKEAPAAVASQDEAEHAWDRLLATQDTDDLTEWDETRDTAMSARIAALETKIERMSLLIEIDSAADEAF